MLIQIILVVAILAGGLALLRAPGGARHQAVRRLLVLALAAFAVVTVLAPGTMTSLAGLVGVGRGTDLLLYGLAVSFFGYTVTSYRRNRMLEEQMTTLARRIALSDAATGPRVTPPEVSRAAPHPEVSRAAPHPEGSRTQG